ncbi:hypothetical protein C8F01DRAFT_1370603 [Mycena amicta]|nr:hypothetical protein C8F01DRAFT_1370603 [Mycena amicta]
MMSDPLLPPELENEIFELVALSYPTMIPTLMRVAQRVLHWTEPYLYRTVRVRTSPILQPFLGILRTKSLSFLASSVRHVLLESGSECDYDLGLEVLTKCTGITSIGTTYRFRGPEVLAALGSLPNLRRMTVDVGELFTEPGIAPRRVSHIGLEIDPAHPVFSHVTHLSLHDNLDDARIRERVCAALPGMPSLTHLRLKFRPPELSNATLRHILTACLQLEVLLLTTDDPHVSGVGYPIDDPRLVWGRLGDYFEPFWADWERGANGLLDMWVLAEQMVKKQRQQMDGEIQWIYPVGANNNSESESEEVIGKYHGVLRKHCLES